MSGPHGTWPPADAWSPEAGSGRHRASDAVDGPASRRTDEVPTRPLGLPPGPSAAPPTTPLYLADQRLPSAPASPAYAANPAYAAVPPPGPPPVPGRRRRRVLFRLAVLLAVAVTAGGVVVAARGYTASTGPADAVRGYFAALTDGDAPTALAYGDVPAGSHVLLTSTVLREQQRIAPIEDVTVGTVTRAGRKATARVTYRIAFPAAPQDASDTIALHETGGTWRLDAVAVATALTLPSAADRATVADARVPSGDQLLFPGAVPIVLDTPYLEVRPDTGVLTFGAQPTTAVLVQVTDAGRRAVAAAVQSSLDTCYGPHASPDLACPLPSERYVPGGLRATTVGSVADAIDVSVQSDPNGLLLVTGRVPVHGTYRRLSFTDQLETGSGTIEVPVSGSAYAIAPVRIRWSRPS